MPPDVPCKSGRESCSRVGSQTEQKKQLDTETIPHGKYYYSDHYLEQQECSSTVQHRHGDNEEQHFFVVVLQQIGLSFPASELQEPPVGARKFVELCLEARALRNGFKDLRVRTQVEDLPEGCDVCPRTVGDYRVASL